MSRRNVHLLSAALLALLAVAALRFFVVDMLTIPHDGEAPILIRGDRVWVNRWSYGLRRPLSRWGGYHRYATRQPQRGDWMVFNNPAVETGALPDTSQLYIGCVLACPGDTIWLGNKGRVSPVCDYPSGCIWPVAIPSAGSYIRITPWNRSLYKRTAERYSNQPGLFKQGGIEYCRFHRDYFWIVSGNEQNMNDSRTFGLVPMEHVVGKAVSVVYSWDAEQPWYRALRRSRILKPVGFAHE